MGPVLTRRRHSKCGPRYPCLRALACTLGSTASCVRRRSPASRPSSDGPRPSLRIFIDADSAHYHDHLDPVTTDAAGRYSARVAVVEQTDFTASAETAVAGPCPETAAAPAGCLSQSVSGPPDEEVTLKVPLLTDAKRVLKAADQAAAARVNLKPTDFPAGWAARPLEPGAFAACPDVHPDEARLTMTGSSSSPIFVKGDFVTTSFQATVAVVRIWRTPAQAVPPSTARPRRRCSSASPTTPAPAFRYAASERSRPASRRASRAASA